MVELPVGLTVVELPVGLAVVELPVGLAVVELPVGLPVPLTPIGLAVVEALEVGEAVAGDSITVGWDVAVTPGFSVAERGVSAMVGESVEVMPVGLAVGDAVTAGCDVAVAPGLSVAERGASATVGEPVEVGSGWGTAVVDEVVGDTVTISAVLSVAVAKEPVQTWQQGFSPMQISIPISSRYSGPKASQHTVDGLGVPRRVGLVVVAS